MLADTQDLERQSEDNGHLPDKWVRQAVCGYSERADKEDPHPL